MHKQRVLSVLLFAFGFLSGLWGTAHAEDGVIGATCEARPVCFDCAEDRNVCRTVTDKFYPGVLMAVAKKAVIKECQAANGLDECGNHCTPKRRDELIKKHGSCFSQCEKVANCIYGDNR